MVAKVREKLAVSKQAAWKLDVERFYLGKLRELEVWKQDQMKISNRFPNFENLLNDSVGINTARGKQ